MEKRLLQIFWSGKVRGSAERYNSGSYTVTSKLVLTKHIFSCQLTLSQLFLLHISFASLALRNTETQLHTVFTAGDPQITSCSITSEHYLEASGGKQQINIWVTEWVNTFTRSLLYFTQSSKFKILFSKIHFQHFPSARKNGSYWRKRLSRTNNQWKNVSYSWTPASRTTQWWKRDGKHSCWRSTAALWSLWGVLGGLSDGSVKLFQSIAGPPPPRIPIVFAEKRKMHQTQRSSPVRGVHRCGGKAGNSCRRDEIWGHRLHESKT